MFDSTAVNLEILKQRAYNLRWATVPQGVIPLTAADPDFPSAPEIAEAITRFVKDRYLCYGPPDGLPDFKESVATFFQDKRNIPAKPAYIFPVDSAAFGIFVICQAFLSPNDEAIIFDPVDFLFRYSVETVGGKAVSFAIPAGTEKVDFEELEQLITPKTRLICLCNPLNPTGKVFTREELLQLGNIACKHNLIILSDEIWSDIIYNPHTYTSIASLDEAIRERTVTVTGYSKSYGLAGLRIGSVMASNQAHFDKLIKVSLHQSTVHGANVIGQIAATTALNECDYWLKAFVEHLHHMKQLCVTELNSMKGVSCIAPEGCYVAFANITRTGKTSKEIHELLLNEAKVAVVPGLKEWFGAGADGYIRLSFATSNEILTQALTQTKIVLNAL
ncbi:MULTISPECIES: pyridoxal phosphate-dependent aminotransferase [unclassified Arcicella]|uniref:pyridoxal phosphate-dependent aminotransferase n=1 Tax=unclassified Arcicella TaxID=2644986 RepID=UPI00285F8480|nr:MULTISPECIES: pyridoxal phosphate-dependent aminotransferase [unclassified Arcicella]MDR6560614.1 aspartate/methionine/tyrosine aminotransferase [Arcicella sp. BE51]MDR6810498.1 aspartate/methionine/tyrosine aminotransferase [Arcicella sp. BE140]MDR6821848.1 aspartate/methionine/tyrosine aminotransferase [Arcicella sp. BE139]